MIPPGAARLVAIPAPDFSLELTLDCGQVFHWQRRGAGWVGMVGERPVYVEQRGGDLLVPAGAEALLSHYFALDHPLQGIYATFPGDPSMSAALEFCRGMRIIRQPPWECVASFILSSMKQVTHISQMSHALRRCFGSEQPLEDELLYAFPTPDRLAAASETALRQCSLGYRAKTLLGSAKLIASGEVDLSAIALLEDGAARAELCRLPGVGEKVANCALLFGFGRLRSFPIDVWIERVLRQLYFQRKRKVTARRLREFSATYFGPFGGYAQQYLFHHARKTWPRSRVAKRRRSTAAQVSA